MNRKPKNLTTIAGIPYSPSIINNNARVSLDFVLATKEGPISCNYYASVMSPNPLGPMSALVHYARETGQEIRVEGRLVETIIDNTRDPKRDKTRCCMNIYQITFPVFGTYIPTELHTALEKELDGQG